ncbi:TIM-barrel domain-containing protein [Oleiagrimonas sp. C23AA]|uniref:TIM-barrel domain-containing protein n=1 Tax=Oleiagrimonas sp. C23AA TaxID=2719047 RepID=UPI00141EFDAD|nr:TIM-barrel domain-containing protein [Oleiagrimonas sp. C23AA]NII11902.1 DUF5110 domain-containing protein [Oleiagrimonas sp. C23AA]
MPTHRTSRRRLRRHLLAACLGAALLPAAHATTTVTDGHARFELLTPSLVRMEYAPDGHFVDVHTAVVIQRDWADVPVKTTHKDGWLVIDTGKLTLRYHSGTGAFDAKNLKVAWAKPAPDAPHTWQPGQVDHRNLGGVTYSLDNIAKQNLQAPDIATGSPAHDIIPGIDILLHKAQPGLLSRSGYALIDDSDTPLWQADTQWISPRKNTGQQDWYLFTYTDNYRDVLAEYAKLCGAIPMVPRWVLGNWLTDFNFEYFPGTWMARQAQQKHYNSHKLESDITRLTGHGIPVDAMTLDFAWHNYGWQGGYDWSPLVPHPDRFIQWLHQRDIKLVLNDHPGYANSPESILSYSDSHAPQVLADLGRAAPAKPGVDISLAGPWKFRTDPHQVGMQRGWFDTGIDDSHWRSLRTDSDWEHQGLPDYTGIAWYRRRVTLPADLPKHLYLYLGDVGGDYSLYINGNPVRHSHTWWPRTLTYADVRPYVKPGQPVEIALKVSAGARGSGIARGPLALRDIKPAQAITFNLADKHQAQVFMDDLHAPLMRQGVDAWWVDGGSGAAHMRGLDPQLWTNKVFYDFTAQATGERGFILGRYGGWGSERYPGYFTGDTYSQWPVLAYEVAFTARAGNVLVPYVSHDIGGFHGANIPFQMYARWVEFGTFSPILRLHAAHENPLEGNTRLPWNYGAKGMALVKKYFRLRHALMPYLYSYAWQAHTQAMPLLRPLYLSHPTLDAAYTHPHEYYFGANLLVAPMVSAGRSRDVYLPPGEWIDYFTGATLHGGRTQHVSVADDAIAVYVRAGGIVPERDMHTPPGNHTSRMVINAYGDGSGHFTLYQDDGKSMAYTKGEHATTALDYRSDHTGTHTLTIGAAQGHYQGQPAQRDFSVRIHAITRPQAVQVDGAPFTHWTWDDATHTARIDLPTLGADQSVSVVLH